MTFTPSTAHPCLASQLPTFTTASPAKSSFTFTFRIDIAPAHHASTGAILTYADAFMASGSLQVCLARLALQVSTVDEAGGSLIVPLVATSEDDTTPVVDIPTSLHVAIVVTPLAAQPVADKCSYNVQVSLQGRAVAEAVLALGKPSKQNYLILGREPTLESFTGTLHDVTMYPWALSSDELKQCTRQTGTCACA